MISLEVFRQPFVCCDGSWRLTVYHLDPRIPGERIKGRSHRQMRKVNAFQITMLGLLLCLKTKYWRAENSLQWPHQRFIDENWDLTTCQQQCITADKSVISLTVSLLGRLQSGDAPTVF